MKIPLLDYGYVEFIEAWGHGSGKAPPNEAGEPMAYFTEDFERGIIEAARQSTQGSFRGWEPHECTCGSKSTEWKDHTLDCKHSSGDAKLLKFLYSNSHSTPFEFAGMVIEVQAPIFVFREWHRHRTQSYNEMSARYTPLPDLYYKPDYTNVMDRALVNTVNKQAGTVAVPRASFPEDVREWLEVDAELQIAFEAHYKHGLDIGIPKEIARNDMPVSHYSRMRASTNLRNWLAFLTLRADPKAQWEIRQFAGAVSLIIAKCFPRTAKLFIDSNPQLT